MSTEYSCENWTQCTGQHSEDADKLEQDTNWKNRPETETLLDRQQIDHLSPSITHVLYQHVVSRESVQQVQIIKASGFKSEDQEKGFLSCWLEDPETTYSGTTAIGDCSLSLTRTTTH